MFLVLGIVLFISLIVAHEYGHFLVAKRNGVEPEEFGIGFPPRIAGKKMGKGIFKGYYTINALPIGGFVQLKGESDADNRKGSFGAASLWSKLKIIYAGVVVNYVLGVLLLTIAALVSLPQFLPGQFSVDSDETIVHSVRGIYISEVSDDSAANAAGIEQGDVVLRFNGQTAETMDDIAAVVGSDQQGSIPLTVYRDNQEVNLTVELPEKVDGERRIGVAGSTDTFEDIRSRYTWSAPVVGFVVANQLIVETFKALGDSIGSLASGDTGAASANVGGPALIIYAFGNVDSFGILMALVGSLSIALAIMNALPIPALDGGRGALIVFFRLVLKRELSESLESKINGIGMVFLLSLIVLITIADFGKIF